MKKFLAPLTLLVVLVLLLYMTACSSNNKKDLSALEEYTSGELRALVGDARIVANERIYERRLEYFEAFDRILRENGYQLDVECKLDGCYNFTDPNDPSFYMMYSCYRAWGGTIEGNITEKQLSDCFCCLLQAIAQVEDHPNKLSVEGYKNALKDDIPFGNLQPDIKYRALLYGYYCSMKYRSATENQPDTYYFTIS